MMTTPRRFRWLLATAVALVAASSPIATPAEEPDREEAIGASCPAVEVEDTGSPEDFEDSFEDPEEPSGPTQLVVIGRAKDSERDQQDWREPVEIAIQKTLYGAAPGDTIRVRRCGVGKGEPRILVLVPDPCSEEYVCRSTLPASEEAAEALLCAARLDFNVLASKWVVVGRATESGPDFDLKVTVERTLYGTPFEAGKSITIRPWESVLTEGKTPRLSGHLEIYCIVGGHEDRRTHAKSYFAETTLPVAVEADVIKALNRRNSYPVLETGEGDEKQRVRRIGLRGSVAEAIMLLGSLSDAAVCLGADFLVQRGADATPDIRVAIERDLHAQEDRGGIGYRRLRTLIRVQGTIEETTQVRLLEELAAGYMRFLREDPPEPLARERHWLADPENDDGANRALAWLMLALPRDKVMRKFADALISMRDAASGGWHAEIQAAMDACHVEDTLELSAAMEKMKGVTPVRSGAGVRSPGAEIRAARFSPSGKLLATIDRDGTIVVRRSGDWRIESRLKGRAELEEIAFSADESSLFVNPRRAMDRIDRIAWRTGAVDKSFSADGDRLTGFSTSADGTALLTRSHLDYSIRVFDTRTGKQIRAWEFPDGCSLSELQPDGARVARQISDTRVAIDELHGEGHQEVEASASGGLLSIAFSTDSKYFVTCCRASLAAGDKTVLRAYEPLNPFQPVGEASFDGGNVRDHPIAASARWVVVAREDQLHVLSLPDLSGFRALNLPGSGDFSTLDLSPDGEFLALGAGAECPRVLKLPGFEPILPTNGHLTSSVEVFFSPDGASLTTVGEDNVICHWDAATMKMTSRASIPPDWKILSIRPDGRFAICFQAAALRRIWEREPAEENPVLVFDLGTGKTRCELKLPLGMRGNSIVWLNEHEAALVTGDEICRFDIDKGSVLSRTPITEPEWTGGFPSGDGKSLVDIDRDIRSGRFTVMVLDLESASSRTVGEGDLGQFTGAKAGLAPGNRFYVGDPGIFIMDLTTLKPVSRPPLKDFHLQQVAFDSTGDRYAVVTGVGFVDKSLQGKNPWTGSAIRIHDTRTGSTLLAMPASTWRIAALGFSPKGDRLAVANDDGTIEVWPIHE